MSEIDEKVSKSIVPAYTDFKEVAHLSFIMDALIIKPNIVIVMVVTNSQKENHYAKDGCEQ